MAYTNGILWGDSVAAPMGVRESGAHVSAVGAIIPALRGAQDVRGFISSEQILDYGVDYYADIFQPRDADLDAISALTGTGGAYRIADGTWALRTLAAPAAGFTITNPAGVAGDPTFVLANDLAALEAMAGTGLVARTAAETYAQRTIAVGSGLAIADAGGVAGNPTISLGAILAEYAAVDPTAAGLALLDDADAAAQRTTLGVGGTIFDHTADGANGTTVETDLYSDSIPADMVGATSDKLEAVYGGSFVGSATATRQVRVYFAGTVIFDSGAILISAAASWIIYVSLIRASSSTARAIVELATQNAPLAAYVTYTAMTGLDFTTANILKITGQAAGVGAATNDIIARMGTVEFKPAAAL